MSTVDELESDLLSSPDDPFRYGWRYVRRVGADGKETWDQVPLTLEDILHPQEEDFRVHSEEHQRDLEYAGSSLRHRLAGRAMVFVDHRLLWDDPELGAHGPDVFVILDRTERVEDGGTFEVAVEGVRPVVIMEVVSPDTRRTDVVTKVEHYHRAGVPFYLIVDTTYRRGRRIRARLIAYRHTPEGYEQIPLNELGRVWLEPLQVWVGIDGVQVRFYDAQGTPILNYDEVARARQADLEARKAAEDRTRLEAKARKTAEARKRSETKARKAAEDRVRQEADARKAAEDRIRELEERLRRAQNPPAAPPAESP
jgi:Uma2 family endonuclease